MGDFNAKSYLWDSGRKGNYSEDRRSREIINFINNNDYVIMNNGDPTRISTVYNHQNSAIDLAIINEKLEADFDWSVAKYSYGSDHLPTFLNTNRWSSNNMMDHIWDLTTTNWNIFNNNCKLEEIFDDEDVNTLDKNLQAQVIRGLEHSTSKIACKTNKRKLAPWWDDELRKLKREKINMLKKFTSDQSKENMVFLKKTNAKFKRKLAEKKQ